MQPANYKKDGGFTLIEILLVLTIIVICVIPFMAFKPSMVIKAYHTELALDKLASDIHYAQVQAITKRVYVVVDFAANTGQYDVIIQGKRTIARDYSELFQFKPQTIQRIVFYSNGSSNTLGSMLIKTNEEIYKLQVFIGKGRFEIVKQ
ncbi:competence type IV pilus minor pilin ComGD [Mangrovibacillus cuniculi]|uniref:Prepilin-type N-terminal cleavage/methylation domain-containing protein n=1 Tax=Mangrovibacillus cuniculi TaxID=2593652 RepID=A0A7S8CBQ1_9BACI|nr:competence type IV pilus minor pilin ComGD [Mangrovibacillus cuniculi]QPC46858.1 prepilin-type N-terminal cleavage/methylation domain-containing protein [Mangrovibacillus cuniculi]